MNLINLALLVAFAVLLVYYYFKRKFSFWSDCDVPFVKPRIPYGNIQGQLDIFSICFKINFRISFSGHRRKLHSSQVFSRFYFELKEQGKFGGIYFFTKPVFFVTNLDLLKTVLIKDFQHFHDRGMYYNTKDDPLSGKISS